MDIETIAETIGEYWNGRAPSFDEEHNTEDRQAWTDVLATLLGPDKNASVVDLGTGTGFLANLTALMGFPSIGVDISRAMLDLAVSNARAVDSPAVYMYGNVLDLPFVDATVDYIVNARLLWTLIRPDDALREWTRILKPGGKVFCFNRFKNSMGADVRPNFYASEEVDGELKVLGASRDDLVDLMARNGFKEVEFKQLEAELTMANADYDPWHVLMGTKC